MPRPLRLGVAGIGNNISALIQGIAYYRELREESPQTPPPGIRKATVGGLGVTDVEFVAAFDVQPEKVGIDLAKAVLAHPNNYPQLGREIPHQGVEVEPGLRRREGAPDDGPLEDVDDRVDGIDDVAARLTDSGAEVLLYSLPTGLQWAATAYAVAAARAGVAFVNCTPERVARDPELMQLFVSAGLPLIGDDLASHLGTSVVHRSLLTLLAERGLTLDSSYQLNIGGNEDFRNLREQGASKRESKLNALRHEGVTVEAVEVIPSAGYVSHLRDQKVAFLNIEGRGWAGTPVSLELRLKVQDSSNAAGVIIDLIRVAAAAGRAGLSGFVPAAAGQLKSPAGGHVQHPPAAVDASLAQLDDLATVR